MSRYLRLREHFDGLAGDAWESSIDGIEEIVGEPLPGSARRYPVWWSNSGGPGRQCDAWVEAGWRQDGVDLLRGIVRFRRAEGQSGCSADRRARRNPRRRPDPPNEPPHGWDAERQEEFTVAYRWRPIGTVTLDADGLLVLPRLPATPGVYRFRVRHDGGELLYVGEADNLRARFRGYRRPNEGQQTNTRLNGEFKSILLAGGEISVAIVEDARIAIDGMDAPADLANKAVRRAIENLAVVGGSGGSGGAVVLLNR